MHFADAFDPRFVQLVRKHKPHCLLHFEDFGVTNAQTILERYRDQHAVFNDDVYVVCFPSCFLCSVLSFFGHLAKALAQ